MHCGKRNTLSLGGIIRPLTGLGVPEEEARYYEQEFEKGRILMTARANGRNGQARRILQRRGAHDMHTKRIAADERIRLDDADYSTQVAAKSRTTRKRQQPSESGEHV